MVRRREKSKKEENHDRVLTWDHVNPRRENEEKKRKLTFVVVALRLSVDK